MSQSVNSVTIDMCRRFSGKARGYMLTHTHKQIADEELTHTDSKMDWTYETNEKIHKLYRSHRGMNAIDGVYIEKVIRESVGVDDKFQIKQKRTIKHEYISMCIENPKTNERILQQYLNLRNIKII